MGPPAVPVVEPVTLDRLGAARGVATECDGAGQVDAVRSELVQPSGIAGLVETGDEPVRPAGARATQDPVGGADDDPVTIGGDRRGRAAVGAIAPELPGPGPFALVVDPAEQHVTLAEPAPGRILGSGEQSPGRPDEVSMTSLVVEGDPGEPVVVAAPVLRGGIDRSGHGHDGAVAIGSASDVSTERSVRRTADQAARLGAGHRRRSIGTGRARLARGAHGAVGRGDGDGEDVGPTGRRLRHAGVGAPDRHHGVIPAGQGRKGVVARAADLDGPGPSQGCVAVRGTASGTARWLGGRRGRGGTRGGRRGGRRRGRRIVVGAACGDRHGRGHDQEPDREDPPPQRCGASSGQDPVRHRSSVAWLGGFGGRAPECTLNLPGGGEADRVRDVTSVPCSLWSGDVCPRQPPDRPPRALPRRLRFRRSRPAGSARVPRDPGVHRIRRRLAGLRVARVAGPGVLRGIRTGSRRPPPISSAAV